MRTESQDGLANRAEQPAPSHDGPEHDPSAPAVPRPSRRGWKAAFLVVLVALQLWRVHLFFERQAAEERGIDAEELIDARNTVDEARCLADRVSQGLPLVATEPADPAYPDPFAAADPLAPCAPGSGLGG